ncbi:MAG TPA: transposase [Trebonia sp.]
MREARKKLAAAVRASGTSLTGLFGVGPVVVGTVIGEVRDVSRFADRDHFAAYDGTAPIEVSSGNRKVYRLSRRGNRRLNHAIHMAAVTQVRHRHSQGRAYYDKKLAEGKTPKEAMRALKRQVSDAIFTRLRADARRAAGAEDPGGQPENGSASSAAGSHPARRFFGQATPRVRSPAYGRDRKSAQLPGHGGPFLDSCRNPAAGEAAVPGGAPAAQRGRTTWTRGETTATLGHEESPEEGRPRPLTQRGFRSARVLVCGVAGVRRARTIVLDLETDVDLGPGKTDEPLPLLA